MSILYLTHFLNGFLMVAMPVMLAIYLVHKFKPGWKLVWIGGATFILSQVGHLPFNALLNHFFRQGILPMPPPELRLAVFALIGGLSAGVWEETFRYGMYRWWVQDARSWRKALVLGTGHGGIEAIVLGLLVLWSYLQMVAYRGVDLTRVAPAEQVVTAQGQMDVYWSLPWQTSLLGAVERAFTLPFHIACSVLVLQVFLRGKIYWLWLAIGWHTLVDGFIVGYFHPTVAAFDWGVYATEAVIGVAALISVVMIFALRTPEPKPPREEAKPPPIPVQPIPLKMVDPTIESIEKSRFEES